MNPSVIRESTSSLDARAIALLLEQTLKTQGIRANVAIFDSCCYILLIAHQLPNPGIVMDWVKKQLQDCSFLAIDHFKIYGRQIGRKLPVWQQEFAL